MPVNPYDTPAEIASESDDAEGSPQESYSLAESLRRRRTERRQWAFRCWCLAFGGVVNGIAFAFLSTWCSQRADWPKHLENATTSISQALFALSILIFVFGPHSWFWFRDRRPSR